MTNKDMQNMELVKMKEKILLVRMIVVRNRMLDVEISVTRAMVGPGDLKRSHKKV